MNLTAKFQKFVGLEVSVREKRYKSDLGYPGKIYEGINCSLDEKDPVMKSLQEEVNNAGLSLRVCLPEECGTSDWVDNRLNVHISKHPDGKYRIDPPFNLG